MKTFKFVIIVLTGIVFLANTCKKETGHDRILFVNDSNKKLYIRENDSNYPDTLIRVGDVRKGGLYYIVNTKTSNSSVLQVRDTWEQTFSSIKNDTLMVFVFDADAIGSLPWDTVQARYMILKRYDLSLEDLEMSNWTITYP